MFSSLISPGKWQYQLLSIIDWQKTDEEKNKSRKTRLISEFVVLLSKLPTGEKHSSEEKALLFKCDLINAFYLFKTRQTSLQMSALGRVYFADLNYICIL